ncbi:MAG: hypothetical protein QN187_09475 [Armatimonadota bacterium]|nr:hypothetical protein [Armatimonadota bacterium]MDR7520726.1 hypothetical protein [Armatimonadota bacterium]MDR7549580.1 hypothetical protein [Armatimonadota bacterium]
MSGQRGVALLGVLAVVLVVAALVAAEAGVHRALAILEGIAAGAVQHRGDSPVPYGRGRGRR